MGWSWEGEGGGGFLEIFVFRVEHRVAHGFSWDFVRSCYGTVAVLVRKEWPCIGTL